ncbi:hypothetical protein [Paraburkholderia solisilvae]|uniref:hypothetical protein n=1 Tax=Paraburkholderia solisilvae TaxID=624376 RepID=UPI0015827A10|nr:hypothetical protein [Paraburkholderia solisilvae]
MTSFLRFLIVLSLAMLTTQGARAHARDDDPLRLVVICAHEQVLGRSEEAARVETAASGPAHLVSVDDRQRASHHCCLCCMTDCGAHCAALMGNSRFSTHASTKGLAHSRTAPRYAGITRAPPVRPPIDRV